VDGAGRASDRFGLLACRSPLSALRALHARDLAMRPSPPEDDVQPPPERDRRIEFLGSRAVHDLLEFMLDPAYVHASRADVG
jgi:hypothetical protein